jgi:hypothetical protein
MTDFRKRLLGICGVALAFAGFANAQYTCGTPNSASTLMRAEGQTEQTADLTIVCSTSNTGLAVAVGTANISLTVSPALAITSKVLGTVASVVYTEALAIQGASLVQGVVTGTGTMSFSGVPTPACAAATFCSFNVTITNVRVNATSLGAGPVSITESALVTAGGAPATVNPTLVAATAVGIVLNGLSAATASGVNGNLNICTAYAALTAAMTVNFRENFTSAFKQQGSVATVAGTNFAVNNSTLGNWVAAINNTETGYTPAAFPTVGAAGSNVANSATRIKIIFSGVPATVSLYVPLVQATTAGAPAGSMTLVTSENGAFAAAPAAGTGVLATQGLLTNSGGTATAIYEITAQANGPTQTDIYAVPVSLAVAANTIAAPPIPTITATVQFAAGTAGNVPDFVVGSTTSSITGPSFGLCSTTMLFPYITNGGGFDTGLAIANTSTDNLGAAGVNSLKAQAQSGTCVFWFYGTNAPASSVVTPSVATGTTYAATLSSLAPGFTGYAIATCNFLYAHSFAYITYNLTASSGVSMGYLGLEVVTPRNNVLPESLGN